MSATFRFRDGLAEYVTRWMSERKAPVMFRVLWTIVGMIDVAVEVLVQGIQARWPGVGTPTALPMIGRSRGILRGQADTDATYAAKLRGWLDRWRTAGTAYAICRELHEWLGNGPRVRVITRSGHWTTIETDGTVTPREALEKSIETMIHQLRAIVGFKEENAILRLDISKIKAASMVSRSPPTSVQAKPTT